MSNHAIKFLWVFILGLMTLSVFAAPTVTKITLVSEKRIARTVFEYTYRLNLKNDDTPRNNVSATLKTVGIGTSIVDGQVNVGNLAANAVVIPLDTFTIRHDRAKPFQVGALVWAFSSSPPPPDAKSSERLIGDAQATGAIDAETALLYRVFSAFDQTRLPAQYRGPIGRNYCATVLMSEVTSQLAALSPSTQAQLKPYLLPAFVEGSWLDLKQKSDNTLGSPTIKSTPLAQTTLPAVCSQPPRAGSFAWDPEDGRHVRVWYQQRFKSVLQPKAALIRDEMEARIWPNLTNLMGTVPRSDVAEGINGCDGRLDIQLIPTFGSRSDTGTAGETKPLGTCDSPKFIEVSQQLDGDILLGVVTHEFMHTLTDALVPNRSCPGAKGNEYYWLDDATADWAVDHVYSDNQFEHTHAPDFLRTLNTPLETDTAQNLHRYGAYVFPFYIARFFSPAWIKTIWDTAAKEDNSLRAIDQGLRNASGGKGFNFFWPQFTRFNWNLTPIDQYIKKDALVQGAVTEGTPIGADGLAIGGKEDDNIVKVKLDGAPDKEFELDVAVNHLSAQYFYLQFFLPVRSVSFRGFEGLGLPAQTHPESPKRVQALVKMAGQADWIVIENVASSDILGKNRNFCLDAKSERLEDVVLIFSNAEWQDRGAVWKPQRKPSVVATNIGCREWVGTVDAVLELPFSQRSKLLSNKMVLKNARSFGRGTTRAGEVFEIDSSSKWQWSASLDLGNCSYGASGNTLNQIIGSMSVFSYSQSKDPSTVARTAIGGFPLGQIPANFVLTKGSGDCLKTLPIDFGAQFEFFIKSAKVGPAVIEPGGKINVHYDNTSGAPPNSVRHAAKIVLNPSPPE